MITTKLTGEPIPFYEQEVSDFLTSEEFEGDGHAMVIAVENENKLVYRIIEATGFGDFMNIIGFLWEVGLTDILDNSLKAVDGFDARFRFEQSN